MRRSRSVDENVSQSPALALAGIDSNALGIPLAENPIVLLESVMRRFLNVNSAHCYIVVSYSPSCGCCQPTVHGIFGNERDAKRALRKSARSVDPSKWLSSCMVARGADVLQNEGEPFFSDDGNLIDEPMPDILPHEHPLVSVDRIGSDVKCDVCDGICFSFSDFTCELCGHNECADCHAKTPADRALAFSLNFFHDYRLFMNGGEGNNPFDFSREPHYYSPVTTYTGIAWNHPNNASVIATAMEAAIDGEENEFKAVVDNCSTGFNMSGEEDDEHYDHANRYLRIIYYSDPGGSFDEKLRSAGPAGHRGKNDFDSVIASLIGQYVGLPPIFIFGKSFASACCGGSDSSLLGIGTAQQCRRLLRACKLPYPLEQGGEPYSAFWREPIEGEEEDEEEEGGAGESEYEDTDGGGGAGGGHDNDDYYERRERKVKLAVDALKHGDHKSEELFDWTKKLNPEEWFDEVRFSWREKWVYEGDDFKGGMVKIRIFGAGCGGHGVDVTCFKIAC